MYEMTLDLGNDYRAHVAHDPHAEKPDFEGHAPTIAYEWRGGVYAFNDAADDYVDYFRRFMEEFGSDWDLLARAVKIVFDCTQFEQFDTQYGTYFIFDPKSVFPGYADHIRANIVNGTVKEYEAYVNGECYGVIVEKKRVGTKVYNDGEREDFTEWVEVDSVWGFYGDYILDEKNLEEIARDYVPAEN